MKLMKADHDRRIDIPGVPDPVRRPVDIDRSRTGFSNLRSLRIYRFEVGTKIDGHAEEDEVLVLVLAGSIEITVTDDNSGERSRTFTLSAADDSHTDPCMVYLPPRSAYRLLPKTGVDVAYARATPDSGPPSAAFAPNIGTAASGATVLLEEKVYCRRLRLRLVQINAHREDIDFTPMEEAEAAYEALVHLRTGAMEIIGTAGPMQLDPWDTLAVNPGEHPALRVAEQTSALILVVLAI